MPIRAARTLRRHRPPRAAATPRVLARRRRGIAARAGRTRKLPARSSHPRSRRGTPRPALASRYAVAPPGRARAPPARPAPPPPAHAATAAARPPGAPWPAPHNALEGAQVGHFEQRLGRQQQGLAGHLGQVVLDQRQLRAATQRLAAPSQALQAALAITQQADGAALEKVHASGMDQQQPRRQLEHARLAFAAPAIELHVQRSQDLPRRLRFRPTLGGTGVVGEQGVEMAFDGLHHVGATASPEQRQEKRRSPSGARREPFGANPRGLPREVAPGAQGETERWLGKRLECHRTPFPARNFSCSCRLYADQFRKNYRNILQSVVLPGSRQTAPTHPDAPL